MVLDETMNSEAFASPQLALVSFGDDYSTGAQDAYFSKGNGEFQVYPQSVFLLDDEDEDMDEEDDFDDMDDDFDDDFDDDEDDDFDEDDDYEDEDDDYDYEEDVDYDDFDE